MLSDIYLTKAEAKHVDIVFDWANESETRKNSFNSDLITYDSHIKWFQNKINDKNCLYFICMLKDSCIGQIRLDFQEEVGVISYSIDKQYRGNEYGTLMLKLLEEYLIQQSFNGLKKVSLVGLVKPDNISSQKSFEKLGFSKSLLESCIKYSKTITCEDMKK